MIKIALLIFGLIALTVAQDVSKNKEDPNSRRAVANSDAELKKEAVQISEDDKARNLRVENARLERKKSEPTRQQLLKERHDFLLEQAKLDQVNFFKSRGKVPVAVPGVQGPVAVAAPAAAAQQ